MAKSKVAVSLDEEILRRIDSLVAERAYPNRSQAVEEALRDKLDRLQRSRLAREASKLDPEFERALAEEGLSQDHAEWPEY